MAPKHTTVRFTSLLVAGAILVAPLLRAQGQQDDVVMRAMKDELARSMSQLQLPQMDKPYFIAYRVQDLTNQEISATLGSLTTHTGPPTHNRMVGVELRVGNFDLDNTNFFSMRTFANVAALVGTREGSLDDNYAQIRRELWLATDGKYKQALEDLSAKRAALKGRSGGEHIPDFSKEVPTTETTPASAPASVHFDDLQATARDLSAVFRSAPEVYKSEVAIHYSDVYTRYVNSEGTSYTRSEPLITLEVSAETQAPDGQPISDAFTVYGHDAAALPSKDVLLARVRQMAALIVQLRSAASLDRYNGPVLFEGTAAGEIVLQQFGSGFATSRTPTSDNPLFEKGFTQASDRMGGASFQEKIGARVLPSFMSVRDNPLQTSFNGAALLGTSSVDEDGVKTRETVLIDHGILKHLLASRVPVSGILQSTGSRHGGGPLPSNIFVTSEKTLSAGELKNELLRRAKERGLDYALVVRRAGVGSSERARQMVSPSPSIPEIYKLYLDGHEEPLRGVRISDLSLESFKEIVATGDAPALYSEQLIPHVGLSFSSGDGSTVVSCVAPSLLFDEVSLAKSEGPFPQAPVSPSPLAQK